MTNKMKWFYIMETGLVTVGDVIGDEQDVFEWIAETEENTASDLTRDDINLDDYRSGNSTYKYYLTFGGNGCYDVEITFKKDEDGFYVIDEIVGCYDNEIESEFFDISNQGGLQFRILSDE
jgi:hypothetical protein